MQLPLCQLQPRSAIVDCSSDTPLEIVRPFVVTVLAVGAGGMDDDILIHYDDKLGTLARVREGDRV